ncbi:hypothetical protein [Deinococcus sp. DB0503]|nr:hypothetical protein [Deinococcus sp. DB0503]
MFPSMLSHPVLDEDVLSRLTHVNRRPFEVLRAAPAQRGVHAAVPPDP